MTTVLKLTETDMKDLKKEAALDCKIIENVVYTYRLVADRVKKLGELGFEIRQQWVGSGGVGTVRKYNGCKGIQISSQTVMSRNGYVGLAYVAYPANNTLAELECDCKWRLYWVRNQLKI